MNSPELIENAERDRPGDKKTRLQQARSLLESGRLSEGEALLQQLITEKDLRSDAYYYLGLIELQKKAYSSSQDYFFMAAQADPQNANACYYSGFVCEQQGEIAQAERFYQKALAINPNHKSALQRLAQIKDKREKGQSKNNTAVSNSYLAETKTTVAPVSNSGNGATSDVLNISSIASTSAEISKSGYEFYQQLKEDPSPAAKKIIALIDELEMDTRPGIASHLGSFTQRLFYLAGKVLGFMIFAGFTGFVLYNMFGEPSNSSQPQLPPFIRIDFALFILFIILTGALIIYILDVLNKEYVFTQGKIIVSGGALTKSVKTIELFKVQEVEMTQDFFNQITGDGSLTLKLSGDDKPIRLIGLAKADDLRHLVDRLRELNVLLRSINWIVSMRN